MIDDCSILAIDWLPNWWDYPIMIGLFLSVSTFVVALFGQGGEVRRSPQREAAIAAGHADRKTVFENPILRPIMWVFLSIAHRLNVPRGKEWIRKNLVAAGSPNYYTPEEYLAVAMLMGVLFGSILEIFHYILIQELSVAAFLLGLLLGMALSIYQVAEKASQTPDDDHEGTALRDGPHQPGDGRRGDVHGSRQDDRPPRRG